MSGVIYVSFLNLNDHAFNIMDNFSYYTPTLYEFGRGTEER